MNKKHTVWRRSGVAVVCAVLTVLLAGCAPQQAQAQAAETPAPAVITPSPIPVPTPMVLEVCLGSEGFTTDPTYISSANSADYMPHIFEGLVKYMPVESTSIVADTVLTAGLADSWALSDDGMTYRFFLREDAYWSDGVPVRAEDFVYAWQRLLTPSAGDEPIHAPAALQLFGVLKNAEEVANGRLPAEQLGVYAESEKTLVVTLEAPCTHFLKLCADRCMVPLRQDVIETHGGDWTDAAHFVASGAYTIESWVHDDTMILVQNPMYYDRGNLGPVRIVWRFDNGEGRAAEADFSLSEEGNACVDIAGTYYLYLNANAIRDWRVRAAMALSVDRDALAAAVGGGASPASGLMPRGISMSDGTGYAPSAQAAEQPLYRWLAEEYPDADLSTYEGRCALARTLYGQALAAGSWYRSYTVYYRFNESELNRTVAEVCQNNWKEVLGLNAEFTVMEAEEYSKMLRSNTFDVAYLSWLPDCDDGLNFLEIMRRAGDFNHSGWGDVRYNEQLDLIAAARDAAARDAMLKAADGMLFEKERFAVCPLFWYGEICSVADGIVGIGHSAAGGYIFSYAGKSA